MMRGIQSWPGLVLAIGLVFASPTTPAGVIVTPEDAPEWKVTEWINGNPGTLEDHKGRVVLIHFFQMWCPLCNDFTVPVFERWMEMYGDRDDVLILGIHSVFEGHDVQTPTALKNWVRDRAIGYPIGVDAYSKTDSITPTTMQLYECEGTPQIAIVDKHGKLRFSHFARFDPYVVEGFVDRLLKEVGPQPGKAKPVIETNAEMSGRFRVTLSQTTKTCGRLIRPLTLEMDVTVTGEQLRVRSRQSYAGMNDFTGQIDTATGQFEARLGRRVVEQGEQVNVNLELKGRFKKGTQPMELEYTFSFEKDAEDPEKQCRIEGRGKGTKSDPNRRR